MDKLHEQLAVELRVSELYLIARLRTLEKLMDADSRFAVGEVAEDLRRLREALAAYDAAKVNENTIGKRDVWTCPHMDAKANGADDVLDLLQRRCDAYEKTLEDIRDDAGYDKESGLRAADVLRRWNALPPPPERV